MVNVLKKYNLKVKITRVARGVKFPNVEDNLLHDKYKVTVTRDGKSISYMFYGSYNDYQQDKKPTTNDVLSVLASEANFLESEMISSPQELKDNHDYKDIKTARRVFKGLKNMEKKASKIFSDTELYNLSADINE